MKNWYGIHTGTAFRQICERSNLYKTTLETLLESSDDDDVTDSDNSINYIKLAKLVATKRNTDDDIRFIETSSEDKEVAREVVKDFVAFSSKKILADIRAELDISEIYNRNPLITVAN